eukprot:3382317-Prorocentrum_lima.AAC.1
MCIRDRQSPPQLALIPPFGGAPTEDNAGSLPLADVDAQYTIVHPSPPVTSTAAATQTNRPPGQGTTILAPTSSESASRASSEA